MSPGSDGCLHPASAAEVAEIVRAVRARRGKLRVVGAGLGERDAIAPGLVPPGAAAGRVPPPGASGVTILMLDRMRAIAFDLSDPSRPRVSAEGGANLGRDPYLASGRSTWDNSLGWEILRRGFALPDFAAVSHHTVAALVASGSCGGSARHSFLDAVVGIELVDGEGRIVSLTRDLADPDADFWAAAASMGLLGVITRVTFELEPAFGLAGRELRKPMTETPVDFFGDDPRKIPFTRYLRETPYCRLVWWPQRHFEYAALWEMARVEPTPLLDPAPYTLLGPDTRGNSVLAAALLTVLGNLDDLSVVPAKLAQWREKLAEELRDEPDKNPCRRPGERRAPRPDVLQALEQTLRRFPVDLGLPAQIVRAFGGARAARVWDDVAVRAIVAFVGKALDGLGPFARLPVGGALHALVAANIGSLVRLFVEDGDSRFQDCWLCGFAIDDQLDARLWPLRFMELAVDLDQVEPVMRALRRYFRADGDADLAYRRTGPFACQIYPGKRSGFWLHSSYGRDTARLDGFWNARNAGDPRDEFFRGLWEVLEPFGFAPHWGKILPVPARRFARRYETKLPKLPAFRRLRRRYDPDGVFLTSYWAEHLDLEEVP